jgi:hypothetical protein
MKKTIIVLSFAALTALAFINCSNSSSKETATEQTAGKVYTCPMHPEVKSDKPGQCPKCGMALVEKKDTVNVKGDKK